MSYETILRQISYIIENKTTLHLLNNYSMGYPSENSILFDNEWEKLIEMRKSDFFLERKTQLYILVYEILMPNLILRVHLLTL